VIYVNKKDLEHLIEALGGQTQLAADLGITRQAVSQWLVKGLPRDVKRLSQLNAHVRIQQFNLVEEQVLARIIWRSAYV
jgi:predicted transcriptional regulator|tara:strand:+ start:398 stop:634 length:237 start_codon:yes stop_codon:yes gene_type:complete